MNRSYRSCPSRLTHDHCTRRVRRSPRPPAPENPRQQTRNCARYPYKPTFPARFRTHSQRGGLSNARANREATWCRSQPGGGARRHVRAHARRACTPVVRTPISACRSGSPGAAPPRLRVDGSSARGCQRAGSCRCESEPRTGARRRAGGAPLARSEAHFRHDPDPGYAPPSGPRGLLPAGRFAIRYDAGSTRMRRR